MNLHIKNGRLIDPANGVDARLEVFVAEGRVVSLGQMPAGFVADRILDATGKYVLPGLVDLAACLPGSAVSANAQEMCAALAGGITRVVCLPGLGPELELEGDCESSKALGLSGTDAVAEDLLSVHVLGAMTVDLRGEVIAEMRALRQAGCVALTQVDSPIHDTSVLLRAMQYAKTFGYALWLRAQEPWLSREGVMASGAYATRLGLEGIPVEAELLALQTFLTLQRTTGVRLHISRLSCAQAIECVRQAKKEGLPVTCDVDANHLHLTDVDIGYYDTNFRLDPPLRGQRDRDALRAALLDGTIDAISSAHTQVSTQDKLRPFAQAKAGATGFELLLSLTLKWAQEARVPLLEAMAHVTRGPAAVLTAAAPDIVRSGQLGVGARADLCLIDPNDYWQVTEQNLLSQSKHSPFLGMELPGRVHTTIFNGRVVWERPN